MAVNLKYILTLMTYDLVFFSSSILPVASYVYLLAVFLSVSLQGQKQRPAISVRQGLVTCVYFTGTKTVEVVARTTSTDTRAMCNDSDNLWIHCNAEQDKAVTGDE